MPVIVERGVKLIPPVREPVLKNYSTVSHNMDNEKISWETGIGWRRVSFRSSCGAKSEHKSEDFPEPVCVVTVDKQAKREFHVGMFNT